MDNKEINKLISAINSNAKLYSVFDRINLGNALAKLNHTHEARVLTDLTIISPDKSRTADQIRSELQSKLQSDASLLNNLNEPAQAETTPFIFQKYGWRIGHPTPKTDYELAVAYCDAFRLEKIFDGYDSDQMFTLIKGDLAGIQRYIYGNIQPKQAGGLRDVAKKLRGRSIIVSLLTDFLAGVILRELELTPWHLLFAGGGHFNILIPENKAVKLGETIKIIDAQMRERFGENLQLLVAYKSFTKDFILDKPATCFTEINSILDRKKFQPHKGLLNKHFETQNILAPELEEVEIELGRTFPKQRYLIETFSTIYPRKGNSFLIYSIKTSRGFHTLFSAKTIEDVENLLLSNAEKRLNYAQVFAINDTDFMPKSEKWDYKKWESVSFGFRFLGKTLPFHEVKEQPKTFEEIVEEGDDENKLLAALRLDVDDLGFIFSRGIERASLGELLTLSREMQYFFSAHFDRLAKEHKLYLIYSGGDDAFAVGKWDNILHFAQELRANFHEFVFENPDVHFSAGIFMGNPHYPVGRFYRDAGRFQDMAKDALHKNRIRVFNRTLSWDEFHSKIELGKTFAEALDPKIKKEEGNLKKLPSAFAYRILNLVKSSFRERAYEDKDGNWYNRGSINPERFARNVAGLRYLFARHGFDHKRSEENVSKIERELIWDFLRSFDFGDDEKQSVVKNYLVALNYAIFKNRAQADKKL